MTGSSKDEALALEIARGNFLRAIEQIEAEDGTPLQTEVHPTADTGTKVEVLGDLGTLLPTYLAVWADGLDAAFDWLDLTLVVEEHPEVASVNDLWEGLLSWRTKWNLLDPDDDPWIRDVALKTLDYWASQLQSLVNEGFGGWVQETFSLDLPPNGPAVSQELLREIEAAPDPRGNHRRELVAHFEEEQREAKALVGKRWWGPRVLSWEYPRGRHAKKFPTPKAWGYADEVPAIERLIRQATPPGMIRDTVRGRDYNLRLLVLFQVKFKHLSQTDLALDRVNRNVASVSRILNETACQVGIELRGKC